MKKIKYLTLYILVLTLLNSCSSVSDVGKVLRNEKVKNTDEFLVKKRDPLTLPPDVDILPKPGTLKNLNKEEENDGIKKIIQIPKTGQSKKINSSSVEQSIIDKIGK
jgi:hypothetical protein